MEQIATGGFSRIFRVSKFGAGDKRAVKVIKIKEKVRWSLLNVRSPVRFLRKTKRDNENEHSNGLNKPMPMSSIVSELAIWKEITEARTPFIIELEDKLTFGNEFWAIMELADQPLLSFLQQLRTEKIKLGTIEMVEFLSPIYLALAAINKLNIVHRDVKPENILICKGYVPKLADFGSAVKLPSRGKIKTTEDDVITLVYAPPEATAKDFDANTTFDTWSLTLTLYSLIIGCSSSPWEAISGLAEMEAATELAITVEQIYDRFDPLDKTAAQISLFEHLGLVASADGSEVSHFIEGRAIEPPQGSQMLTLQDEAEEIVKRGFIINDVLDKDCVNFVMKGLRLLIEDRPTITEMCDDEYIKPFVTKYQSAETAVDNLKTMILNKKSTSIYATI